jgi:hypothetical protein
MIKKHTRSKDRPPHLASSVLQVVLDLMLGREMGNGRGVLPAVLVAAPLHAAVDKVLDAGLDRGVDHGLALPDLALVRDAFALRDLHAVHAPDGAGGDFGGTSLMLLPLEVSFWAEPPAVLRVTASRVNSGLLARFSITLPPCLPVAPVTRMVLDMVVRIEIECWVCGVRVLRGKESS